MGKRWWNECKNLDRHQTSWHSQRLRIALANLECRAYSWAWSVWVKSGGTYPPTSVDHAFTPLSKGRLSSPCVGIESGLDSWSTGSVGDVLAADMVDSRERVSPFNRRSWTEIENRTNYYASVFLLKRWHNTYDCASCGVCTAILGHRVGELM